MSPGRLAVSAPTRVRFVERITRLCEQTGEAAKPSSPVRKYVRRWQGWARAVKAVEIEIPSFLQVDLPPPARALFYAELEQFYGQAVVVDLAAFRSGAGAEYAATRGVAGSCSGGRPPCDDSGRD